jgi:N-acetylglutamate synthase-like GNAT family acetyltransferase
MPPTLHLRAATAADWPAIAAVLTANGLPIEGAEDHLHTFIVAESNGEVVGAAGAELYGDTALVRSVAVSPGLQRQGVGRQMVELLIAQARRRSLRSLHLLTMTAASWFERFGFEQAGRDGAPPAMRASVEFKGACPASATFMSLMLAAPRKADPDLPVAVLGAGPVGLAAAARLIERGIPFVVLEAGGRVGANLLDYGHVRLFSPWRYNIDASMVALLAEAGWQAPPAGEIPLAREVVERVLQPFAALPQVASSLRLSARVVAVTREGFDKVKSDGRAEAPFVVRAQQGVETVEFLARAVIDATGTWRNPNPLGAGGLPAIGEAELADRIFYGIPDVPGADRARYDGKCTLVVGAGHSAANALLALADLAKVSPATQLVWAVRSPVLARVFGGGEADALPARGQLGSALRRLRDTGALEFVGGLRITELRRQGGKLTVIGVDGHRRHVELTGIDEVVCATGQRPDLSLTRELRVKLDPWLESTEALGPLIDPNVHSCGTVRPHGHRELAHPEPGLYTVGVKSYGRAPTFLMATGFEQARSVVAAIAGDLEAADRVELELPETGVCSVSGSATQPSAAGSCCGSVDPKPARSAAAKASGCCTNSSVAPTAKASGCCGGAAKSDVTACCALDEQAKAEGRTGCGCSDTERVVAETAPRAAPTCCA